MKILFEILAFSTLIFQPDLPPQPVGFTLYETPIIENKIIKSRIYAVIEGFNPCSCISGAKYILKVPQNIPWGDANEIKANINRPVVGGLILLNEGPIGHSAVVIGFSDVHITIEEYNGVVPCGKSVRSIPRDYPLIRGFRKI